VHGWLDPIHVHLWWNWLRTRLRWGEREIVASRKLHSLATACASGDVLIAIRILHSASYSAHYVIALSAAASHHFLGFFSFSVISSCHALAGRTITKLYNVMCDSIHLQMGNNCCCIDFFEVLPNSAKKMPNCVVLYIFVKFDFVPSTKCEHFFVL